MLNGLRRLGARLADRDELYGINRRNVELVYAHNPRVHYPIADDKLLAKTYLRQAGVPVPDTLHVCDGLYALPDLLRALEGQQDFVIKPSRGSGGHGILVVGARLGPGRWRRAGGEVLTTNDLQRELATILFGAYSRGRLADRAFVETRIMPHAAFEGVGAEGLCDVRVITLRGLPLMAMLRVPTAGSGGRANLHQGGLGLAIDFDDGRVFRAFTRGHAVERHPDTGARLIGFQIPRWREVVDVARAAAAAVPLGYLGVDAVVDRERGPLVLEINARPGLEIQNVHGYGLGRALERAGAKP